MNELTLILFIGTLALFVTALMLQRREIYWLTFFTAICSMGETIMDTELGQFEAPMLVALAFFVMMLSGWTAWGPTNSKGGR